MITVDESVHSAWTATLMAAGRRGRGELQYDCRTSDETTNNVKKMGWSLHPPWACWDRSRGTGSVHLWGGSGSSGVGRMPITHTHTLIGLKGSSRARARRPCMPGNTGAAEGRRASPPTCNLGAGWNGGVGGSVGGGLRCTATLTCGYDRDGHQGRHEHGDAHRVVEDPRVLPVAAGWSLWR